MPHSEGFKERVLAGVQVQQMLAMHVPCPLPGAVQADGCCRRTAVTATVCLSTPNTTVLSVTTSDASTGGSLERLNRPIMMSLEPAELRGAAVAHVVFVVEGPALVMFNVITTTTRGRPPRRFA